MCWVHLVPQTSIWIQCRKWTIIDNRHRTTAVVIFLSGKAHTDPFSIQWNGCINSLNISLHYLHMSTSKYRFKYMNLRLHGTSAISFVSRMHTLGILYVTGFYVALAVYASLRSFIKVMYVHVECKYGETGTPITNQYLHRSTAYCAMCVAV